MAQESTVATFTGGGDTDSADFTAFVSDANGDQFTAAVLPNGGTNRKRGP